MLIIADAIQTKIKTHGFVSWFFCPIRQLAKRAGVWYNIPKEKMNMAKRPLYIPGGYNPGNFKMNKKMLKKLRPELFELKHKWFALDDIPQHIKIQLQKGDTETAVVVSVDPLLVACYSGDMDAVVLLCLPTMYGVRRGYQVGISLLTVNGYDGMPKGGNSQDVYEGPDSSGRFRAYGPIIADLYTADCARLEGIKALIPEEHWDYVMDLGFEYMENNPGNGTQWVCISL